MLPSTCRSSLRVDTMLPHPSCHRVLPHIRHRQLLLCPQNRETGVGSEKTGTGSGKSGIWVWWLRAQPSFHSPSPPAHPVLLHSAYRVLEWDRPFKRPGNGPRSIHCGLGAVMATVGSTRLEGPSSGAGEARELVSYRIESS